MLHENMKGLYVYQAWAIFVASSLLLYLVQLPTPERFNLAGVCMSLVWLSSLMWGVIGGLFALDIGSK